LSKKYCNGTSADELKKICKMVKRSFFLVTAGWNFVSKDGGKLAVFKIIRSSWRWN